jgi:hypothetical protein
MPMSGDRTWYTVTVYRPELAAAQALDAAMAGQGFQPDEQAHPDEAEWQAADYPAGQALEIAEQLLELAERHRFAFEVCEEATDFDMGRRYTYLPGRGILHQATIGNDHHDYLPVDQVRQAIDQTATRQELVEALEAAGGLHIERDLETWRDQRDPPAAS